VFFVDRGLLMGAKITTYWKYNISNAYLSYFKIAKPFINSRKHHCDQGAGNDDITNI
jgi:hypothetical protein